MSALLRGQAGVAAEIRAGGKIAENKREVRLGLSPSQDSSQLVPGA